MRDQMPTVAVKYNLMPLLSGTGVLPRCGRAGAQQQLLRVRGLGDAGAERDAARAEGTGSMLDALEGAPGTFAQSRVYLGI